MTTLTQVMKTVEYHSMKDRTGKRVRPISDTAAAGVGLPLLKNVITKGREAEQMKRSEERKTELSIIRSRDLRTIRLLRGFTGRNVLLPNG